MHRLIVPVGIIGAALLNGCGSGYASVDTLTVDGTEIDNRELNHKQSEEWQEWKDWIDEKRGPDWVRDPLRTKCGQPCVDGCKGRCTRQEGPFKKQCVRCACRQECVRGCKGRCTVHEEGKLYGVCTKCPMTRKQKLAWRKKNKEAIEEYQKMREDYQKAKAEERGPDWVRDPNRKKCGMPCEEGCKGKCTPQDGPFPGQCRPCGCDKFCERGCKGLCQVKDGALAGECIKCPLTKKQKERRREKYYGDDEDFADEEDTGHEEDVAHEDDDEDQVELAVDEEGDLIEDEDEQEDVENDENVAGEEGSGDR